MKIIISRVYLDMFVIRWFFILELLIFFRFQLGEQLVGFISNFDT